MPKGNRYKEPEKKSFAYTQTIVCLYPNDCLPILKHLFAYTQFETHFRNVNFLNKNLHPIVLFCIFAP